MTALCLIAWRGTTRLPEQLCALVQGISTDGKTRKPRLGVLRIKLKMRMQEHVSVRRGGKLYNP